MARRYRQGGGYRQGRAQPFSTINVTPLVDVMLVLLIVFMITAPLLSTGIDIELPQSDAPALSQPQAPLVITIRRDGSLFLQETKIKDQAALVARLQAVASNNPDIRLYIRGDAGLSYGNIMGLVGAVSAVGFTNLSLVAAPVDK